MATVTGLTAARMEAIEAASIVDAALNGSYELILTTFGGTDINVGNVRGATGIEGLQMWRSATQLGAAGTTTTGVAKDAVPGRTIAIGDIVMSRHASSLGYFGYVTAVASQTSVSVYNVGTLRGPAGSPPALDGATLTRTSISNATASWAKLALNAASADSTSGMYNSTDGCIDIQTTGTYLLGAMLRTPAFVAAHPQQLAVVTSVSAYSTANEVAFAATPDGVETHGLNCTGRAYLTAGTKLALWFLTDTSTAMTLTELKLWAQRIK